MDLPGGPRCHPGPQDSSGQRTPQGCSQILGSLPPSIPGRNKGGGAGREEEPPHTTSGLAPDVRNPPQADRVSNSSGKGWKNNSGMGTEPPGTHTKPCSTREVCAPQDVGSRGRREPRAAAAWSRCPSSSTPGVGGGGGGRGQGAALCITGRLAAPLNTDWVTAAEGSAHCRVSPGQQNSLPWDWLSLRSFDT